MLNQVLSVDVELLITCHSADLDLFLKIKSCCFLVLESEVENSITSSLSTCFFDNNKEHFIVATS